MGDRLADVDLALAIQSLGKLHVCEPAARLVERGSDVNEPSASAFDRGRRAQRLFWRQSAAGGIAALALHPFSIAADVLAIGLGLAGIANLAGRAVATLELGAAHRQQERIGLAKQRLDELSELRAIVPMPRSQKSPAPAMRRAA